MEDLQSSHGASSSAWSSGVCLMRNTWIKEQHPSFINFISTLLSANSFCLNLVPIGPVIDVIFNCEGLSVAFVFVTNWECNDMSPIFNRIHKLRMQFARLYVVVTLSAQEHISSFVQSYFKFEMVIGKPTFAPVQGIEMGFEKNGKNSFFFWSMQAAENWRKNEG